MKFVIAALAATLLAPISLIAADAPVHPATTFRAANQPVTPSPDGTILCEAEEFHVDKGDWRAQAWGANYYAATFANTFLSRKAFLGAPEQCDRSEATIAVHVPRAGRYLALVRYEAVYRFEKSRIGVLIQFGELDIAAGLLAVMAARDASRKRRMK